MAYFRGSWRNELPWKFLTVGHPLPVVSTERFPVLLWYGLGRPVTTSEIGNWSVFVLLGWRFVFGIIIKRDGREPRIVRCHHDSGNNKAASLLRLPRAKVSNHHGLAKLADLQGDTLCLRPVTLHPPKEKERKKKQKTHEKRENRGLEDTHPESCCCCK